MKGDHEGTGVVAAIGDHIKDIAIGDRVGVQVHCFHMSLWYTQD